MNRHLLILAATAAAATAVTFSAPGTVAACPYPVGEVDANNECGTTTTSSSPTTTTVPVPAKVLICHRPDGSPTWFLVQIDPSAVAAHLAHSWGADVFPAPKQGGCPVPLPEPPTTIHPSTLTTVVVVGVPPTLPPNTSTTTVGGEPTPITPPATTTTVVAPLVAELRALPETGSNELVMALVALGFVLVGATMVVGRRP